MASIKKRPTTRGDRYDVRLRVNGRVVTKTFPRRKDADNWARLMEADRVMGRAIDPGAGRVKLAEYSEDWVCSRRLAPRTVELYRDLLARMVLPTFGATTLAKIGPDAVRRWHKALAGVRGPTQAAKAYRLLRAMLNTAVGDGLIGKNPCQVPGAGQERSAERPMVTPDIVLDLADAIAPRYRALVLLAGFGGLRRGELLGLRRRDVDLGASTVTVDRQVHVVPGLGRFETAPKSHAGRRTVHVPAVVLEALELQLATWSGPGEDGAVFTGDKGGPLSPTSLYPAFDKAKSRAKVEGVTLHDLRHAAGTIAAWTGATTRELMARLGHSTSDAAMRYQHAAGDRDRELAERLDVIVKATSRRPLAEVVPLGARDGRAIDDQEDRGESGLAGA